MKVDNNYKSIINPHKPLSTLINLKINYSLKPRWVILSPDAKPLQRSFSHTRRVNVYHVHTACNRDAFAVFQIPLYCGGDLIIRHIHLVAVVLANEFAIQRVDSHFTLARQIGNLNRVGKLRGLVFRESIVWIGHHFHRIKGIVYG